MTTPWIGSLPRIGIRPTIDGRRRGVRESLEGQIMAMAKAAASFLSENLRHPDGQPVECVIADTCIGGVAEAAACAEKFAREGVGVSLTVTPCWCYGSETMDMDPLMPKAVWGFNGTERPGAVYLAAVLAGHNQKGLPAFGIYGRDVQDAGDTAIPADVGEKLLRFARAGLAVATMRGKSYLSLGGVSMGIAGSIVDQPFFEHYLGMRVECVDMSEVIRRIEEEIYDKDEFSRALAWVTENCKEGKDYNPEASRRTSRPEGEGLGDGGQDDPDRPRPDDRQPPARRAGLRRGSARPQRDRRRLPGPAPLDRPLSQRRLHGGHPHLVVRLERHPQALHRGDRERQPQRRRHALRLPAHQHRPDLRRRPHLLEPRGRQARHRPCPRGPGRRRHHPPDQLRGRHARRHGPADPRRQARDEAVLGDHRGRGEDVPRGHDLAHGHPGVLPRRRLLVVLPLARRHADDDDPPQPGQGPGAGPADRRGLVGRPARRRSTTSSTSARTPPGRPPGSSPT